MTGVDHRAKLLLKKFSHLKEEDDNEGGHESALAWDTILSLERIAAEHELLHDFFHTDLHKAFDDEMLAPTKRSNIPIDDDMVSLGRQLLFRIVQIKISGQIEDLSSTLELRVNEEAIENAKGNEDTLDALDKARADARPTRVGPTLEVKSREIIRKMIQHNKAQPTLTTGPVPKKVYDRHAHLAAAATRKETLARVEDMARRKYVLRDEPILAKLGLQKLTDINEASLGIKDLVPEMNDPPNFEAFKKAMIPFNCEDLRGEMMKIEGEEFGKASVQALKRELANDTIPKHRLPYSGKTERHLITVGRFMKNHDLPLLNCPFYFQFNRQSKEVRAKIDACFSAMMKVISWNGKDPLLLDGTPVTDEEMNLLRMAIYSIEGFDITGNEQKTAATTLYSYVYRKLVALNRRQTRRWKFCPHAGEYDHPENVWEAYYFAEEVGHALFMGSCTLQLLFVIHQIPVNLCLISNDRLTVRIDRHPIVPYLEMGMRVSLGSDDPLVFHETQNPLQEEFDFLKEHHPNLGPNFILQLKWNMAVDFNYFESQVYVYQAKFRNEQLAEALGSVIPRGAI